MKVTLLSQVILLSQIVLLSLHLTPSSGLLVENTTRGEEENRSGKALSLFTVVQFPNTVCDSSSVGRNGTCYTANECQAKGGSTGGTCASGFGVCCVFERSCGAAISENNTYFTSSSLSAGSSCSLKVCKCSTTVCQLRLDFETFILANPVTVTDASNDGTLDTNRLGNCDTDSFQVTVPGGKATPKICGINTGQHMYVPASDQCNHINSIIGSATATRSLAIKVSQVECSSKSRAPSGCLQYFTAASDTIQSFNYNSGDGVHLAEQDYTACIRSARSTCAICYYVAADTDFKMSTPENNAMIASHDIDCGRPADANGGAADYILIPDGWCAPAAGAASTTVPTDRFCGQLFACAETLDAAAPTSGMPTGTVCSMAKPFSLSVFTDSLESAAADGEGTTLANSRGFQLSYFQDTTCLVTPDV